MQRQQKRQAPDQWFDPDHCVLNLLGNEELIYILSFLSWHELLSVGQVCHRMRFLSQADRLWRRLYQVCWHSSLADGPPDVMEDKWKHIFKAKWLSQPTSKLDRSPKRHFRRGSDQDPHSLVPHLIHRGQRKGMQPERRQSSSTGTVVLLGAAGVGKTSLLYYLNHETPLLDSRPSLGATYCYRHIHVDSEFIKLKLWDTAGGEQYRVMYPLYVSRADVVLLIYSLTDRASFTTIQHWHQEYKSMSTTSEQNLQFVLVACKCDLDDERQISKEEMRQYAIENDILISMEVSCLDGKNVSKLFLNLCRYTLPWAQHPSKRDSVTFKSTVGSQGSAPRLLSPPQGLSSGTGKRWSQ